MANINPFDEEPTNPFDDDDKTAERSNPFESPQPAWSSNNNNKPVVSGRYKKSPAPAPPVLSSQALQSAAAPRNTATTKLKLKSSASIVKTLIPVEESTAQHHELFLQEIEAVDEYWGPTFRGVY